MLVAGGKSNHLHLWCLESKQLLRIIQMPTKVRAVRHLEFLPDSFDGGSNQVSCGRSLRVEQFVYSCHKNLVFLSRPTCRQVTSLNTCSFAASN